MKRVRDSVVIASDDDGSESESEMEEKVPERKQQHKPSKPRRKLRKVKRPFPDSDDEPESDPSDSDYESEDDGKDYRPPNPFEFNTDMGFIALWDGSMQQEHLCTVSGSPKRRRGGQGGAGQAITHEEILVRNYKDVLRHARDEFKNQFVREPRTLAWFHKVDDSGNRLAEMMQLIINLAHDHEVLQVDEFIEWEREHSNWVARRNARERRHAMYFAH